MLWPYGHGRHFSRRIWRACECMLLWMLDLCRVVGGGWTGAECCGETVVVGQCRVVGGGWTGADCCCLSLARATRLLRCEFILWFRFSILLAASLVVESVLPSVVCFCWRASLVRVGSPRGPRAKLAPLRARPLHPPLASIGKPQPSGNLLIRQ